MFLWCGIQFDRPLYIALFLGFGLSLLGGVGLMGPTLAKVVPMYHFDVFMYDLMPHGTVLEVSNLMEVWESCVYLTSLSFLFLILSLSKIQNKDFT